MNTKIISYNVGPRAPTRLARKRKANTYKGFRKKRGYVAATNSPKGGEIVIETTLLKRQKNARTSYLIRRKKK